MKFNKLLEEAREKLIESLKYIGDLDSKNQSRVIDKTNAVLKCMDSLLQSPTAGVEMKPLPPLYLPRMGQLTPVDPASEQRKRLWEEMDALIDYKLMVQRLEPQMFKGVKISGYLKTFSLPTTIPDIIEEIGKDYGGGKYQIRIVDNDDKYVKSQTFEISGLPKIDKRN